MRLPPTLIAKRRRLYLSLVVNGLAQAGSAVLMAWLIKEVFDHLLLNSQGLTTVKLVAAGAALCAAAVGLAWLRMRERVDAERLGQDYALEIRLALFDRLSAMAPRVLEKHGHGGLTLRFVGDLTALRRWVSLGLARLTVTAVTSVGVILALAMMNMPLALAVSGALAAGTLMAMRLGERLRQAARESRRRLARLATNVSEKVATMAVVQLFGQAQRERERMLRQGQRLHDAMIERARAAGKILAITELTTALASAAALLVGVYEVSAGRASVGTVVAAMAMVGILVPLLRDLGRVQEYWHGAYVAREKIQAFLEMPTLVAELPNAPDMQAGRGRLEFDQVSFAGRVQDIRAVAEPGTVVAIVGPNGAGKSTLLALAARLLDPDSGVVRVDGQDLTQHNLASVRRVIGMVSPDLPLLRGTVEKNLHYRLPRASKAEVARVRELCAIDEVLAELPQGEQTRLGEGGAGLSSGQRLRIALARALLGAPPLLLLDEADANLDPQGAQIVDRVLAAYTGTVLLVTHRLDRLAAADMIWCMDKGRIVECGTPQELLAGSGPTAKLFKGPLSSTA